MAPLSQSEGIGAGSLSMACRRSRLEDLAAFTPARVAARAAHVADHVQGYRSDIRWVSDQFEALLLTG